MTEIIHAALTLDVPLFFSKEVVMFNFETREVVFNYDKEETVFYWHYP